MIRKIVSAGQTGVEIAALDIAIKLGISHGGWTSLGMRNEDGPISKSYQLVETSSIGFREALRKNVSDSDGTLVISKGERTDQTANAVRTALSLERQLLHVDLSQYALFEAASLASSWMSQRHIKTAHITGLLASEDDQIYGQTRKLLETALYLGFVKSEPQPGLSGFQLHGSDAEQRIPQTVSEAIDILKALLSLKDKTMLANLQAAELNHIHSGLWEYIKQHFGLYTGNRALLDACAAHAGLDRPLPDEACAVIIRTLWEDLRRSHKLRVVK